MVSATLSQQKVRQRVQLYTRDTLAALEWPNNELGRYARAYLPPLMMEGVDHYIANVKTTLSILRIDDLVIPITLNDTEYSNSYVCSPYTYYVSNGIEFTDKLTNPLLKGIIRASCRLLGSLLHAGEINKVAIINNWLLPTNLLPELSVEQLSAITNHLKIRFPDHTILIRSIDSKAYELVEEVGFSRIASRKIYFMQESSLQSRMFKSDKKILLKSGYETIENKDISGSDIPRIITLYRSLYLDKYSKYSPLFTEKFIQLALETGTLKLMALKKEGRIDAVMGYYWRNGCAVSPLFGYDATLPQQLGLYRQISTLLALEAEKNGLLLNQSAGADSFKQLRRGRPEIEYMAFYVDHLPWLRRMIWKMLKWTVNTFGIGFM